MTDFSRTDTTELIARFIEAASRLGSVFNLPLKLDRKTPEGKALSEQIQLLGEELRARKPISDIRSLYDHSNPDVRHWAAGQFLSIDPEWASVVYNAVQEQISTSEVVALIRRAKEKPPKRRALPEMSVADLVRLYEDASIRLSATRFMSDEKGAPETENYNRIMDEICEAANELRARQADNALLPLLEHPNPVTRRVAADTCLPIATQRAIQVLEAIADKSHEPMERACVLRILGQWRKKHGTSAEG